MKPLSYPEIGLMPPQDLELESVIIGCLILEQSSFLKIEDILTVECFYKDVHQYIFDVVSKMNKADEKVDILTVVGKLKANGKIDLCGGASGIIDYVKRVSSSVNIEDWANIIKELFLRREMIRICNENMHKSYNLNENYKDILNSIQSDLLNSVEQNNNSLRHISEIAKEVIELMRLNSKSDKQLSGLPTGFMDLDRSTGGLQKGDLIIIAGETSNGKTALALNIAQNCALFGHKIGIFSYEMTDVQLVARNISAASNVSSRRIMFGQMDDYEIDKVISNISTLLNSEIYIEKTNNASFEKLEIGIRSAVIRNKIELVVIDYLQLIKLVLRGQSKADAVAEIANSLKQLAITLNIPIILLSQLSRDKENPRPTMQRLKGSGDIENAADIIYLVWRPEMYHRDIINCNGDDYDSKGLAHLIQAKGRNIGTGEFVLNFNPEITLFTDFNKDESFFKKMPINENFDYPQ